MLGGILVAHIPSTAMIWPIALAIQGFPTTHDKKENCSNLTVAFAMVVQVLCTKASM